MKTGQRIGSRARTTAPVSGMRHGRGRPVSFLQRLGGPEDEHSRERSGVEDHAGLHLAFAARHRNLVKRRGLDDRAEAMPGRIHLLAVEEAVEPQWLTAAARRLVEPREL